MLYISGRTGHWINHGKEHCLVGLKGSKKLNRGIDCDVIVAEVRATSHKPDEIYGIIERLSPGTRKIELFGRPHNVQPNWVTLGNQLDGIGKHFTKLFAIAKKSSIYRASDIFSILRTMPFFNLARGCCRAEQASCLACSLGISVEEYCMDNALMSGCEKGNIYKMTNCWLVSQ